MSTAPRIEPGPDPSPPGFLEVPLYVERPWLLEADSLAVAGGELSTIPHRLGRYVLLLELGHGASGRVFVAHDERLGRDVALKILPRPAGGDAVRMARLEREARILAALAHPAISTVYALEQADGYHFLSMELLAGEDLARHTAGMPLRPEDALGIAAQIASALEAAHAHGVIHCDLKPGNVFVLPSGRIKVIDFGLAERACEGERGPGAAATPALAGTPGFMAPEQIEGHAPTPLTDVWGFGAVLFHALAGRPPFVAPTLDRVLHATLHDPPRFSSLPDATPAAARTLVARCLEKRPERRPASWDEIQAALRSGTGAGEAAPAPRGNVPRRWTRLVGRHREKLAVQKLLAQHRLVTLTGVGGSGKSRLALEAARELEGSYSDGVWFVACSAIADPMQLSETLARSLGARPQPGRSTVATLIERLESKRLLVVLDDCERPIAACRALVRSLLDGCPKLRILATSREPLAVDGETLLPVPRLALPSSDTPSDALLAIDSVALLFDRAGARSPGFEPSPTERSDVIRICRLLDGIPLALELAAARLPNVGARAVAEALEARVALAAHGKEELPHHRSLHALFDWSYDLLLPAERAFFRRLSVFRGGFTLAACEAVCATSRDEPLPALELLARLAEKSLIEVHPPASECDDGARYSLLEMVRTYAADRLDAEEDAAEFRSRHRHVFAEWVERGLAEGADEQRLCAGIRREHANLCAALAPDPASKGGDGARERLRLAAAVGPLWARTGAWNEARALFEAILQETPDVRTTVRARVLHLTGGLAYHHSELETAAARYEDALAIHRATGNCQGIAGSLNALGSVAALRGDSAQARALYEQSIAAARAGGYAAEEASARLNLGNLALDGLDCARARAELEASLSLAERLGDRGGRARALHALGMTARAEGTPDVAASLLEESLELLREAGDVQGTAAALNNLGLIARERADVECALRCHEKSLRLEEELGDNHGIAISHVNLGLVAREAGDLERARAHNERALALRRRQGAPPGVASALRYLAMVESMAGNHSRARELLRESLLLERRVGERQGIAGVVVCLGRVALGERDYSRAITLLAAAEAEVPANLRRLPPEDLRAIAADVERARAALGDRAFEAARAAGAVLTLEEALDRGERAGPVPSTPGEYPPAPPRLE